MTSSAINLGAANLIELAAGTGESARVPRAASGCIINARPDYSFDHDADPLAAALNPIVIYLAGLGANERN